DLRNDAHWRTRIRDGLHQNQFFLEAQPIAEIATGRIAFHEALLRLAQPPSEPAPPDLFLPAARRFQLMTDIDQRVVRLTLSYLRQSGSSDLSVNLSAESLADPAFSSLLEQTFYAAGVEPRRVILEISEQGIIENFTRAQEAINSIRGMGFRVALDDFGAGFSSLKHLRFLPLDLLKIDGAFIRGLPSDPKNQILVKTLADLARQLAIQTVAEYVEDSETLALLRELGIDYAQGSHIAMPGPLVP
ncbi:MAG: EAL domain-containing protein, partial [Verrucomicrobiia bacterium]